ncbi:MAG: HD-GYP domain-containing protein [Caldisericia bacterium]|nr:HD-GYP domain-containing protein [Caldisericia bacterium]
MKEVTRDILVGLKTLNYEKRLKDSLLNLARGITKIVELRDPSSKNHGETVAKLAYEVGKRMGLDEEKLDMLYIAALIHDIGKISISMEILNKPFKLREVEYEWVKQHTYYGYEYLKDLNFPLPIAEIILEHHERIDGSGYPKKLKGNEIMIEAKIIAVCEVFHAMISHKPYRPPHSIEETLDYIRSNRGILFDEKVVDTFFEVINEGILNR